MTKLEELVMVDREIKLLDARRSQAERLYLRPIEEDIEKLGARANDLWRDVLAEYGPGAAQDALRRARGEE